MIFRSQSGFFGQLHDDSSELAKWMQGFLMTNLTEKNRCQSVLKTNSQFECGLFTQSSNVFLGIKKHTFTNERQSQGIRIRLQIESIGLNEHLPVSPFQRDTTQTKSMQEEVLRVNCAI